MNRRQSTWMLHFIVLIFGFTGILGKLISLDAEQLVFWRVLLGGGLVWLWLAVRGRVQRFPLRSLWKVALVGCTAAAHWIAFFASIKVSNVSVALATLATTPVFVSVVEPWVHKRRVDVREVVLGVVIIGGLLVLLWGPAPDGAVSDLSQYYLGVGLAGVRGIGCGVCYAQFSPRALPRFSEFDPSGIAQRSGRAGCFASCTRQGLGGRPLGCAA